MSLARIVRREGPEFTALVRIAWGYNNQPPKGTTVKRRLTLLLALCLSLPVIAQTNSVVVSRDEANAKHAIAAIKLALDKAGLL